jgi:hypothetical protein
MKGLSTWIACHFWVCMAFIMNAELLAIRWKVWIFKGKLMLDYSQCLVKQLNAFKLISGQ